MSKVIELKASSKDTNYCIYCGCEIFLSEEGYNWFWEESICSTLCEDKHNYPEWYNDDYDDDDDD